MESDAITIIVILSLFLLLCFIGVILNAVLLVVFVKHSETRTPENILLINLCISDIMYAFSFLSYLILIVVSSEVMCIVTIFFRSLIVAVNVYSVVALSIQRYIGLKSFRNRLPTDKTDYRTSVRMVVGVWTTAGILAVVETLLIATRLRRHCFELLYNTETLYRLLAYAVIPSVLIAVFYIASARRVTRSVSELPQGETNATLEALRDCRKRSARILLALAVVFAITYLPFYLYTFFWNVYLRILSDHTWLTLTVFVTAVLNPIFNPIALIIAGKLLRQLYKKYCCCCCLRLCTSSIPE